MGIDIGTYSIRVVEINKKDDVFTLENYGEVKTSQIFKTPAAANMQNGSLITNQEVALIVTTILREAGMTTKYANFSVPDFSSFYTSFELPPMTKDELSKVVKYEARSYIPLPLSEVTLDWVLINKKDDKGVLSGKEKSPVKVLVVAISNQIVNNYKEIAAISKLDIKNLEAEAFALARACARGIEEPVCLVDIGARSTTVNILENGLLKMSHSINVSGNEFTQILSKSLRIDYERADELKKRVGLMSATKVEEDVKDTLLPLVDSILLEVRRADDNYYNTEGQRIKKVVLAGGSALMPGLKEYVAYELKKEVQVANPFASIAHEAVLGESLTEMGPSFAIAVGLCLKGLE